MHALPNRSRENWLAKSGNVVQGAQWMNMQKRKDAKCPPRNVLRVPKRKKRRPIGGPGPSPLQPDQRPRDWWLVVWEAYIGTKPGKIKRRHQRRIRCGRVWTGGAWGRMARGGGHTLCKRPGGSLWTLKTNKHFPLSKNHRHSRKRLRGPPGSGVLVNYTPLN